LLISVDGLLISVDFAAGGAVVAAGGGVVAAGGGVVAAGASLARDVGGFPSAIAALIISVVIAVVTKSFFNMQSLLCPFSMQEKADSPRSKWNNASAGSMFRYANQGFVD